MTQNSLKLVRNSIFAVTTGLAALIISLPSGASDVNMQTQPTDFSGLTEAARYNPALVNTDNKGDRYRLNPAFRVQPELQPRTIFSVSFDQKALLPLSASLSNGLKKRSDIRFDRDRSLLADFRLSAQD